MAQPKILAFAGSLRRGSLNKQLVRVAAAGAEAAGAEVTVIDLSDYPLPIYDGDLEASEGLPEMAVALQGLFRANDGLLLACPEYNGSMTAVFKNTIDWMSRPSPAETLAPKIVSVMSASPGAIGGMRGLVHVRGMFANMGMLVLPGQLSLPKAHEAFDETGRLKDARMQANAEKLGAALATAIMKWAR